MPLGLCHLPGPYGQRPQFAPAALARSTVTLHLISKEDARTAAGIAKGGSLRQAADLVDTIELARTATALGEGPRSTQRQRNLEISEISELPSARAPSFTSGSRVILQRLMARGRMPDADAAQASKEYNEGLAVSA